MPDGSGLKPPRALRTPLTPPLKWAGGKRWLVQRLADVLTVPIERLIEPFAGSAAAFFRLRPQSAILADKNSELINVYKCLKSNHERVQEILSLHAARHSKDYYYLVRDENPADDFCRAARTIYLNRTCWNALYRVNRRGQFNVPQGTKNNVILPSDDFFSISVALSDVSLRTCDFVETIRHASSGDLIFADPPYISRSKTGTFVKYTNPVFRWKDQERLAKALMRAHQRGAMFILTNADCGDLAQLYSECGYVQRISRQSVISGTVKGRKETSELL